MSYDNGNQPQCSYCGEQFVTEAERASCEEMHERPRRSWPCGSCHRTVEVWQAGYDVSCDCGAQYNAFGQRLRDDWRGNSSWYDEDMDDMEGYERQHLDW